MHIKPFGWAVIGTGRIANTVMSEVTKTGRHKVVAVYSRTISKAQSFADKFNAKCFDNLKSALTCDGVEGVYIATPHSVHFTYIMKCIDLGIPILCEKSFTVNATQAIHALKYAEGKKSVFMRGDVDKIQSCSPSNMRVGAKWRNRSNKITFSKLFFACKYHETFYV